MNTNQKTNIIGAILAALVVIQPILTNGTFNWSKDWVNLVVAGAIAGLSYYIGKK